LKYLDRFKNFLAYYPYHSLDQAYLCQIIYEGFDQLTRIMLEPICQDDSLSRRVIADWEFLEDLAEKTMQWKTSRDNSLSSRLARVRMHFVFDVCHLESKIVVLENMLKRLSV